MLSDAIRVNSLTSVLSALCCIFGTLPNLVRFRQLERAVAGKTADGRTVFYFGLEFNVDVRVGHGLPLPELKDRINRAADLATRMDPQVSHFYYLGLTEDETCI